MHALECTAEIQGVRVGRDTMYTPGLSLAMADKKSVEALTKDQLNAKRVLVRGEKKSIRCVELLSQLDGASPLRSTPGMFKFRRVESAGEGRFERTVEQVERGRG